MSVLDPFSHALAAVVAAAHTGLTSLGADPASSTTWVLCIATVVVVVRVALLPLVVHGVRQVHASARARPQLGELAKRYRNRKDPDSLRAFMSERRRIAAEHNMSRLSVLPLLVQLPIWLALYHLVADVAAGVPVGAMNPELAASLGAARCWVSRWPSGATSAPVGPTWPWSREWRVRRPSCRIVTQKFLVAPNAVLSDVPEVLARTQQMIPAISAVGLVIAGGVVPVALLVYWVCNAAWTLGQSAVVWRWFPTPGSPAATRRSGP